MKLSDAMIKCLLEENVEVVFGYPGAAVLDIYESLRTSSLHHVLVRQEQAAVHSASGYARTTGKVGVCIATSGPGATNLITGIATAYMDSIPIVIFTGQVKSHLIGRDVFQEVDITGATEPFIKHSYLLKKAQDLPKIIKEAFYIAGTGRPGPVLIDIPMDLQEEQIDFNHPKEVKIRGYKPTIEGHIGQLKKIVKLLQQSKKPLVCAGGGVILGGAKETFQHFIKQTHLPIVHTLMGTGAMPTNSSYNMGMIGTHGFSHANWALKHADTVLFLGTRIADRAVNNPAIFNEKAKIIHMDIDPAEIGKITSATIPVVGDVNALLNELSLMMKEIDTKQWIETIQSHEKKLEEKHTEENINPKAVITKLSKMLGDDAIITADVGQNQFWTMRHMEMKESRQMICSGGFGTMGYSLPAAIGACIANRDKKVVSILGDGSFQMSFFELGTLIQENVKPLIILFNNSGLGMVRELQHKTEVKEYGVALSYNPDFPAIAKAYGIQGKCIINPEQVEKALEEALTSKEAYLLEFIISDKESTL